MHPRLIAKSFSICCVVWVLLRGVSGPMSRSYSAHQMYYPVTVASFGCLSFGTGQYTHPLYLTLKRESAILNTSTSSGFARNCTATSLSEVHKLGPA